MWFVWPPRKELDPESIGHLPVLREALLSSAPVSRRSPLSFWLALALVCWFPAHAAAQELGTVRGVVSDQDFQVPLPGAEVQNIELRVRVLTGDDGSYSFPGIPAGKYTLVFLKDGYFRAVRGEVEVRAGQLTDVDVALAGDFTDMEEFVVQELLQAPAFVETNFGTETAVFDARFESPALLDGISADLMTKAGASDAAGALRLVTGATVQDGKYAVIRGLPDRYVSSQMNGVRLPSADEDKRAVELDQFPSTVIDSLEVAKTFTPDQQGDASGGAVNVRLKGIPEENTVEVKAQYSLNTQVAGSDFLTYRGGGVGIWGYDRGSRDIQYGNLGGNWTGATGTDTGAPPVDWKTSITLGGKTDLGGGWRMGGSINLFYERDSSFYDNGRDDSYWVESPGAPMTPTYSQGTPSQGEFKTSLFDITQGTQQVQWGGLGVFGLEGDGQKYGLTYLYSRTAEDSATLAVDTRGKEYFFPGYDPNNSQGPGNTPDTTRAAPYLRLETLEYVERTTSTFQLNGEHKFSAPVFDWVGLKFEESVLDWRASVSAATMYQPDKRQFGSYWLADSFNPGVPPFLPPFTTPAAWYPYAPAENFTLGNLQRIWKEIEEDSNQLSMNWKLPFVDPQGNEGYLKTGLFADRVDRRFNQDSFSNFADPSPPYESDFDDPWSQHFPDENHPITGSNQDVDYAGNIDLTALYGMADVPLNEKLNLIGGLRLESTKIGIINDPEADALWYPPGAVAPVDLNPGDADVDFSQTDLLPSLGVQYKPDEELTLYVSVSQTVARQTFKELTPIIQQEYLGGPIFIGNPELEMSSVNNFDIRADWVPAKGRFLSASIFHKDLKDPIEYVQRLASGFDYTTAVNYPKGRLSGIELEARQQMGELWPHLSGWSLGSNATLIDSQVTLSRDESKQFDDPTIQAPLSKRDMTNAPEYLFNLYTTYDFPDEKTQVGLFYTVTGDTLVAGAGTVPPNFIPDVYAKEFDSLNFSLTHRIADGVKLQFQAKNITNPAIEEVYRSPYIGDDVVKTSYTRGIEYSIGITGSF